MRRSPLSSVVEVEPRGRVSESVSASLGRTLAIGVVVKHLRELWYINPVYWCIDIVIYIVDGCPTVARYLTILQSEAERLVPDGVLRVDGVVVDQDDADIECNISIRIEAHIICLHGKRVSAARDAIAQIIGHGWVICGSVRCELVRMVDRIALLTTEVSS